MIVFRVCCVKQTICTIIISIENRKEDKSKHIAKSEMKCTQIKRNLNNMISLVSYKKTPSKQKNS